MAAGIEQGNAKPEPKPEPPSMEDLTAVVAQVVTKFVELQGDGEATEPAEAEPAKTEPAKAAEGEVKVTSIEDLFRNARNGAEAASTAAAEKTDIMGDTKARQTLLAKMFA